MQAQINADAARRDAFYAFTPNKHVDGAQDPSDHCASAHKLACGGNTAL